VPLRLSIRAPRGERPTPGSPEARFHEVEVAGDADVVIGRARQADIELPFPRVSARHARIFSAGSGYRVEDLGSSNGTWLRGRRLSPRRPEAFAVGDCLEVGGVELRLAGERARSDEGPRDAGTETLARRLVRELFEACPPAEGVRLIVLSGPDQGRALELPGGERTFTIGRGDLCDLVLSDADVSREHAAIERAAGGFVLRDLGSKNGLEVGGEPVVGARVLRDGDVVRLGETHLRLVDPEERYLRQMETDEGEGLAAAPPDPAAQAGGGAAPESRPNRLPTVATVVAATALVLALGLVLALALGRHL